MSRIGYKQTEEHKKHISEALKGKAFSRRGQKLSEEHKRKIGIANSIALLGHTPWNKGLKGFRSGKKHPLWKGGITEKNHGLRESFEMRQWRKNGKKHDDYRCLDCGERGGVLNSDHIYQFADYPRLRFEPMNHQTLCKNCHKAKTHFERVGIYQSVN